MFGQPTKTHEEINPYERGTTEVSCPLHFMRKLLAHVPHRDKSMIAALVRMVFAQPNREAAGQQLAATVEAMQIGRLKALKGKYDPGNLFRLIQNITPQERIAIKLIDKHGSSW